MPKKPSWKEEAWDTLLKKLWDNRAEGVTSVVYTKADLNPILSQYTQSGQGEIRIFNSSSNGLNALKLRGVKKIPLTRDSWRIVERPAAIELNEPSEGGKFTAQQELTAGMIAGIDESMRHRSNPGETTLLAIANHIGIIADFYNLKDKGVLFTGGRQKAGIHLVVGDAELDMTKAQIEIDGGFEWRDSVVIAEMKSSFKQKDFDVNQALIPMLKWQKLLVAKKVYSLVMLAQTNRTGIEYWAYDFAHEGKGIGMKISKSKKYLVEI
ncbi:MAG: hypothetical protein JWN64_73 [Parcubacteria group bacterium]|nr:hypothetical protein [Parcubacteria group bacterium]